MQRRAYIETSIPSFYYETRPEPAMVALREWTVTWWDNYLTDYEAVTSAAVLEELEGGDYPNKSKVLGLVRRIKIVSVEPEIDAIVCCYIDNRIMPDDPTGDALHLALASYHKCDYLVTWNCRHLANANKFSHIRSANNSLGLFTPALVTPLQLMQENDTNER